MNDEKIREGLKEFDQDNVGLYVKYINFIAHQKNNSKLKNPWVSQRPPAYFVDQFKKVARDNLVFDGVHITLQSTGVSYDYVAYKNKMYSIYPESVIDVNLVYKNDSFSFRKESGKIAYTFDMNDPFNRNDSDIIGGFCVIKNKRGEFLTIMNDKDIEKHRKVAKTDYIWKQWPQEMALKTVVKKACKQHFADIYQNIETIDNENYDIELPLDISPEVKAEIERYTDVDALNQYLKGNESKHKNNKSAFHMLISRQKEAIENGNI